MATIKEILHVLADGISLTGPAREQLHADIDAHDQAPEPEPDGDVSRETTQPAPPSAPSFRPAGA